MRFIHLADLHLGKMLHGMSLIEKCSQNDHQKSDQADWVDKFLSLAAEIQPDAVVIAGDVYDRGLPPGRAAQLLSAMVTGLAEMDIPVMITAGNHDSIYHLSFLSPLLAARKVQNHVGGGKKLDALFIDEGFGTLSPDVLDKALEVLNQLTEGNRLVGIISHVDKLDESIPQKIRVTFNEKGSHLQQELS